MNDKEEKQFWQAVAQGASEAACAIACELRNFNQQRKCEFEWSKSHESLATKSDLDRMENRIMSAFSEWSARNGPKIARIQAGVDKLQELISTIQNSPGAFTPEDQATADEMERVLDAIGADADSVPAIPPVA